MSKTILAIVAVLAVFAVLYITESSGIPGLGASTRITGLQEENNGIIGRFADYVAESTWYPVQFSLGISFFVAASAGLVLYWKRLQD